MTTVILPYKMKSRSATSLAREMGILKVRPNSPLFDSADIVINWGHSSFPNRRRHPLNTFINGHTDRATNKLAAFKAMADPYHWYFTEDPDFTPPPPVPTPDFTTEGGVASQWLAEGHKVVVRHTLRGHGGAGIQILTPGEPVPAAPLYTKYIPKDGEWRIHATRSGVFHVQKKRRRAGVEASPLVRNLANGWVFTIQDATPPSCVAEAGAAAVRALGLDFGAADVIYNRRLDRAYVLEVNTAPGLEGTTLVKYVEMLRAF